MCKARLYSFLTKNEAATIVTALHLIILIFAFSLIQNPLA